MVPEDLHHAEVEPDGAHHRGVVDLDRGHLRRPGDDLDARLLADEVLRDERAGVLGLEGVLEPDGDAGELHRLRRLRVDRLHPDVGELVRDVVVGHPHDHGVLPAHDLRVGRGEVELLVDDGLVGLELDGDLAEGDLRVAAVELPHDALDALRVPRDDHHLPRAVHALEALVDALVDRERVVVVEPREVHEQGLDALRLEDLDRVVGAVRLADGGEHLARGEVDVVATQVPAREDVAHRVEVGPELVHPLLEEAVGLGQVEPERRELLVHPLELAGEALERGHVVAARGEARVDPGLPGLLVLEQQVRDAGVRGHDVDPAVGVLWIAQHDVAEHVVEAGHRGAANLFDADHGRESYFMSGPWPDAVACPGPARSASG